MKKISIIFFIIVLLFMWLINTTPVYATEKENNLQHDYLFKSAEAFNPKNDSIWRKYL